jgi:hypothetical protein
MAKAVRIWVVLTVLQGAAGPVMGQCAFVDGGPMLNQDMSWGDRKIRNAGVSVGGGVRIGTRTEVRVLVEVPPVTRIVASHDEYRGNPPVAVRVTNDVRIRNRTVSAMLARLFPVGHHSDVTASVGWSSSRCVDDPGSSTWGGPVFGFGGIVVVARHFAVVPEARAIWYPAAENGSVIFRTGLGARWMF